MRFGGTGAEVVKGEFVEPGDVYGVGRAVDELATYRRVSPVESRTSPPERAIATLDYTAGGRVGWRAGVAGSRADGALFGRRTSLDPADLLAEAADHIEVVRRLWDSWEDDAEIRDAATGRFVDRDKLHYIDFSGRRFSVKGPSITPRPPQGQPPVVVLAHGRQAYALAARAADVVLVTAADADNAREIVAEVHEEDRAGEPLRIFGDLVVFLDERPGAAADRLACLDEWAGAAFRSDAPVFAGTPGQLVTELAALHDAGLSGFRLRPGTLPHDLTAITRGLTPRLRAAGLFRESYDTGTPRDRLGLPRPANRYTVTGGTQ